MKKFKIFNFMLLFLFSCSPENNIHIDNVTISVSDFSTNVDENISSGTLIGKIEASTNQGSLTYSILEQSQDESISINSTTGEIKVLRESLFNFEINPIITGIVKVENGSVLKYANITINLNDIDETSINHQPIYYFENNNLKALNLDNQGIITSNQLTNNQLTKEIYDIAYDPSDGTFFGTTDYAISYTENSWFESYNPVTGQRIKTLMGASRYNSVAVNTNSNKKILVKNVLNTPGYKVVFQEVNSNGQVLYESAEVNLGSESFANFIFISSLNSYIAFNDTGYDLHIAVVNADTYSLQIKTIPIDYPNYSNSIYSLHPNRLNYDKVNNIIYYARTNGIYTINVISQSVELIDTNWINFFQSNIGNSVMTTLEVLDTIYYPPTNEIIITGRTSYGINDGNKIFAVNLTTKTARTLTANFVYFDRVYGFAIKN